MTNYSALADTLGLLQDERKTQWRVLFDNPRFRNDALDAVSLSRLYSASTPRADPLRVTRSLLCRANGPSRPTPPLIRSPCRT